MPEYLTPGVYTEEIPLWVKPIEGVETSTAGFLGLTERGLVTPSKVTSMTEYIRLYGGYQKSSYMAYAVEGFFENGGKECYVGRIINKSNPASVSFNNIVATAIGPGEWGKNVGILVLDVSSGKSEVFKLIVAYWSEKPDISIFDEAQNEIEWTNVLNAVLKKAQIVETYDELSLIASTPQFYAKVINSQSNLIKLAKIRSDENPDIDLQARPLNMKKPLFLETADKDNTELSDFLGDSASSSGQKTGLEAFRELDRIKIVYCPDIHISTINNDDKTALRNAIVRHCESMKNCFAIFDTIADLDSMSYVNSDPIESSYAAIYCPWIKILDPLSKDIIAIPPGGHVAGIYAKTDFDRGVHKVPANEIVKGALALEFPISNELQHKLNSQNINVIREFPARGLRVWGARTCSSDPEFKYINVRRFLLFLEESIRKGTQWVIFEPNDQNLWVRVKQSISNFLTNQWRNGALMGSTADQAFFADAGFNTMTQADIDNGRFVCTIGVALVRPAEFVMFRVSQKCQCNKISVEGTGESIKRSRPELRMRIKPNRDR